ncbi:hypothetical protein E2C01_000127 [Portunus trituberculatus]|uniref:Uncharacterized protein n=1 Tax=Portunus trituberculatus TaxID=210409 RepID=A0A5B7CIU1_PORTR|nr:hypothetical protein [Portunus trituberculatus]
MRTKGIQEEGHMPTAILFPEVRIQVAGGTTKARKNIRFCQDIPEPLDGPPQRFYGYGMMMTHDTNGSRQTVLRQLQIPSILLNLPDATFTYRFIRPLTAEGPKQLPVKGTSRKGGSLKFLGLGL